jgi:hypothetical protein
MIVQLPIAYQGRPATARAAPTDILRSRMRQWAGRALNWLGAPGAVKDVALTDKLTGQRVSVNVGELFVRFSVNDRDYYFDRITGRFDGSGSSPS